MPNYQPSYCYIMASRKNGTLYVGVTTHLEQRIHQHKVGAYPGFTSKYDVQLLVWYEVHEHLEFAIQREKQLKKWKREWKIELIEENNSQWQDLYDSLLGEIREVDSRVRGNDVLAISGDVCHG